MTNLRTPPKRLSPKEGMSLPEGTFLKVWPRPVTAFDRWRYGILVYGPHDTRIFQSVEGAKWQIEYWDDYAVASEQEFIQYKEQVESRRQMESTNFFRKYSDLIAEAEGDQIDPNLPDNDQNEIDLPDESLMDDEPKADSENNGYLTYDQVPENDPVINLSRDLHVDSDKINKWLKANNYELTPVGGLSNNKGNV